MKGNYLVEVFVHDNKKVLWEGVDDHNNIIIIIATIKGSAPVLNSLMEYLLIA